MMTLNAAHFSASKPSSSVARIKCPVEETGRNSVTPSTMPRMIAISRIGIGERVPCSGCGGQIDSPAGELAAFVEAPKPVIGDSGERDWLDAKGLEAGEFT